MFTTYKNETVMTSSGNIYLLQYASFINEDVMKENIKKLDYYLVYEVDNKYYVYLGVYTNLDTALKVQKILEEKEIHTYLKNDYLSDSKIIDEINKYDEMILKEDNREKISEMNKQVINFLKMNF